MTQELTRYQKIVREIWLICSLCLYLPLNLVLLATAGPLVDLWKPIIGNIFTISLFYYCAYKKHGTGLLGLKLIMWPLSLVLALFMNITPPQNPWLLLSVEAFWYVLDFMLYRVNKQIQNTMLFSLPEYINAMKEFETIFTLEDLNQKFGSMLPRDDNLAREGAVVKAYEARKHFINSQPII